MKTTRFDIQLFLLALKVLSNDAFQVATPIFSKWNHVPQQTKQKSSIILNESPYAYASVDMNMYNLELENIIENWVANLSPGSIEIEEGVYLGR